MRLLMLDTSVFPCSKTCWSYPVKKSVLNVVVGGLTDHISTYPFSYSQSGLTRKVVIMEIPTNSMSISYSVVACCGFEPPQWVMSPICNHLHLHAIYYVLPRGIEPRFSGWKPDVLTDRRWEQKNQYLIRFTDYPNLVDLIGEDRFVTISYYGRG